MSTSPSRRLASALSRQMRERRRVAAGVRDAAAARRGSAPAPRGCGRDMPSAMLKTTSTFARHAARAGSPALASSGTTTCPWLSMARVMAWMVSGASYSASRSSPRVRVDALHVEREAHPEAGPPGARRARAWSRRAVAVRPCGAAADAQDREDRRVVVDARRPASRRRARRRRVEARDAPSC